MSEYKSETVSRVIAYLEDIDGLVAKYEQRHDNVETYVLRQIEVLLS